MTTTTRTLSATALALLAALALAGCSGTPDAQPTTTAPVVVETNTPVETPAPVETEPEIVAGPYDQVIDGVLYTGTERAPIRIGTDTPGQPPAAQAQATSDYSEAGMQANSALAQSAGKYLVWVTPVWSDNAGGTNGGHIIGYGWTLKGIDRFGDWRPLATGGAPYKNQDPLPSVEAALADPKVLDGRVLDPAEYVLVNYVG